MESSVYAIESQVEEHHWWFEGRRKLLSNIIAALKIPLDIPVLDVGTSTGTNLRLMRKLGFTDLQGVDISDEAIRFCADKGFLTVTKGDVCSLPFGNNSFGFILATDVIEHVDDDTKALMEIKRVIHPDGFAVITVPAFSFLWGVQDNVSHHKRRYTKTDIGDVIKNAGLYSIRSFYFNYLLFAPIWIIRRLIRLFNIDLKSENQINTNAINYILKQIFAFDIWSAYWIKPPFGVSIVYVVKKRAE